MTDAVRRIDVAVVGVTGLVGEALLAELEQREFPVGKLYLLASEEMEDVGRAFHNRSHPIGSAAEWGRAPTARSRKPHQERAVPSARASWWPRSSGLDASSL